VGDGAGGAGAGELDLPDKIVLGPLHGKVLVGRFAIASATEARPIGGKHGRQQGEKPNERVETKRHADFHDWPTPQRKSSTPKRTGSGPLLNPAAAQRSLRPHSFMVLVATQTGELAFSGRSRAR